ncbi:MAG: hypothetical protein WDM76_05260 [Limisphaerales bacterium]
MGSARASRAVFSALAEHTNMAGIRVTKIATDGASAATREGARAPQSEFYALTISKTELKFNSAKPVVCARRRRRCGNCCANMGASSIA